MMCFLIYAEGWRKPAMVRQHFAASPARVRPTLCEDCLGCAVRCPNGVRVRQRVIRAQTVLA